MNLVNLVKVFLESMAGVENRRTVENWRTGRKMTVVVEVTTRG